MEVRRLNRPPRRKPRTDALAPAREAREVVEADRYQTTDEKVNDLRAPRRARRVRDHDQNSLAGADDLFERLRVEGVVNQRPDFSVRQRSLVRRFPVEQLEATVLELERDCAATVFKFNASH